jgi:hypothetical protein
LPQTLPQWLWPTTPATRPAEVGQRTSSDGVWREYGWREIADRVCRAWPSAWPRAA